MRDITVDKATLLERLQTNRAAHLGIFQEACEGYRREAVRQLEQQVARIKEGSLIRVAIQFPLPEDHTFDYDRVIAMLEMADEEQIQLSEDDFAAYVMDDWAWKRQFLIQNAHYSTTARDMSEAPLGQATQTQASQNR